MTTPSPIPTAAQVEAVVQAVVDAINRNLTLDTKVGISTPSPEADKARVAEAFTVADIEKVQAARGSPTKTMEEFRESLGARYPELNREGLCDALALRTAEVERLREAIKVLRTPDCFACGASATDRCRRSGLKECGREFHGGTREVSIEARSALETLAALDTDKDGRA